jgi:hypothetical protein
MSHSTNARSIDLVRWSFTVSPDHRTEIETHLDDLGADVSVRGEDRFTVTWEEPEADLEGVVEAIWSLNGTPFEVTQEEFQRLSLYTLEHAEDAAAHEAA